MKEALLAAARETAAKIWAVDAAEATVVDVGASFPWFRRRATVMAVHRDGRRLLLSVDETGGALAVAAGDQEERLAELNAILAAEGLDPSKLPPESLALTCRAFLEGPGGWVGSPKFLEDQSPAMAMWTTPNPEKGADLFRDYCRAPQWKTDADRWRLRFYYFNRAGGVEEWTVQGQAGKILSAERNAAAPDGTFLCPYA